MKDSEILPTLCPRLPPVVADSLIRNFIACLLLLGLLAGLSACGADDPVR